MTGRRALRRPGSVTNAVHRTFDSTYCDQMQAAAASADKEEEGRIGDGDDKVSDVEYDDGMSAPS